MLKEILQNRNFIFNNNHFLKRELLLLSNEDKEKICNILNDFKSEYYDNKYIDVLKILNRDRYIRNFNPSKYIHGIYHVERVFFYCYIMVKKYNEIVNEDQKIDDELAQVLYYAALYHDIGRLDNKDDYTHGSNSAIVFSKLFDNEKLFKRNPNYLLLTQFLMAAHSLEDNCSYEEIYNIIECQKSAFGIFANLDDNALNGILMLKDKFDLLIKFLKDADAIDRKRFGEWTRESLKGSYLRTSISKDLVGLSTDLNKIYYELIKANYALIDINTIYSQLSKGEYNGQNICYDLNGCFHSIGFDFFKIKSIINYGILSFDAAKNRNIVFTKNFPGGNFDRWISVISDKLYANAFSSNRNICDSFASEEFTEHGITFYCEDVVMRKPIEDRDEALENGLPWNKSNYEDELYVYDTIPSSKISCILIPYKYKNSTLENLRYIHESTNMDIINDRIRYYLNCTNKVLTKEESESLFVLTNEYLSLIEDELSKSYEDGNQKEYRDKSKKIMAEINKIVAKWVVDYYSSLLKVENPTVEDVIRYEISNLINVEFYEVKDSANFSSTAEREQIYIRRR